jgi:peptide chain release factor 2
LPTWETVFDLAARQDEVAVLERKSGEPGLWDNPEAAQAVLQKLAAAKAGVEPLIKLSQRTDDALELVDMLLAEPEPDSGMASELISDTEAVREELERFELEVLLNGEYDSHSAIVEINAGAGGTESCDWAQLLQRMYMRWAASHGYEVEIGDEVAGDVAGIKNTTLLIHGRNAYGFLKAERGVHRLVRISPFDSNKRRHTSFASVDVLPEVEETDNIAINPDEIRVDTFRSSGAGGQHVNKTDSAVRIVHLPTGIVVTCQNERSQHKNRAVAMKVLQAKLLEIERRESAAKMNELRGELQAIEWGSQIRSYVFDDRRVKDHRTGVETSDVIGVMDGNIDPFIQAWLQSQTRKGSD